MKPSASSAARTSRPVRKIRTRRPKRSLRRANSSTRKPSTTTSSSRLRRRRRPPRSKRPVYRLLRKPGVLRRACLVHGDPLLQHRDRRQRGRGVLLHTISHGENIRSHHRDLTPGLDDPRTADQAFAGRGREQVELVFRRQCRLAARGRRRDRGGVVDQESGDGAVEEAVLLQQLGPPPDLDGARAARELGKLGPDQPHESLAAYIVANEALNG